MPTKSFDRVWADVLNPSMLFTSPSSNHGHSKLTGDKTQIRESMLDGSIASAVEGIITFVDRHHELLATGFGTPFDLDMVFMEKDWKKVTCYAGRWEIIWKR